MLKRIILLVALAAALLGCSDPAASARSAVHDSEILRPVVETRDGTLGSGGYVFYQDSLIEGPLLGDGPILKPPAGYAEEMSVRSSGTPWEYLERWVDVSSTSKVCSIDVKRLTDPDVSIERPAKELLGRGEIVRVEASCE